MHEEIHVEPPLRGAQRLFDQLAGRLKRLVAGVHVEHIGSTAVPGLIAKPIIDVMLEWPSGARPEHLIETLEGDGFWHWYLDPFRTGRLMFVDWSDKGVPPVRKANVHVVPFESSFWRDQIAFRDALRATPALRDDYSVLKRELALRCGADVDAYTEGKTDFVRRTLEARRQSER